MKKQKFLLFFLILPLFFPARMTEGEETQLQNSRAPLGTLTHSQRAFLRADGVLEAPGQGFLIVPWIFQDGRVLEAKVCTVSQSLQENDLPIPSVIWNTSSFNFQVKAFMADHEGRPVVYARYLIKNRTEHDISGKFYLGVQPEILPESPVRKKFIPIEKIQFSEDGKSFLMNQRDGVFLTSSPSEAGVFHYESGYQEKISRQGIRQIHSLKDPDGLGAGVLAYPFHLKKGEKLSFYLAVSKAASMESLEVQDYRQALEDLRFFWRKKISGFEIQIPEKGLVDIARTNLSWILLARKGTALCSGTKSAECLTSETFEPLSALLSAGLYEEAQAHLDFLTSRVSAEKEVPAWVVPEDKVSSEKENQNQGRFVGAVLQTYQFSQDFQAMRLALPAVKLVLEYLKRLREQRLTDWYAHREDQKPFYGLLPSSWSWEEGRAEPQHYYKDDWWAIQGWRAGQMLAGIMGEEESLPWMKEEEEKLRRSVLNSMELISKTQNNSALPFSAESGRLDPQTAAAAVLTGEDRFLPYERVKVSLEEVYREFLEAKESHPEKAGKFSNFNVIRALLIRDKKKEALEMFRYQLSQRPELTWHQWGMGHGNRGSDMPDTVQAARFILALRSLFVMERNQTLILGSGIIRDWIAPRTGLSVRLPTAFGEIRYRLTRKEAHYQLEVEGEANPPEGFLFISPASLKEYRFQTLPSKLEIE